MIKKALVHKTDCFKIQLFRYLFVGGFAFAVDFAIFALLTEGFGVYYLISNVFAFGAGLLSNYLISIKWVFATRSIESRRREFTLFALIGLIGLAFNQAVLWVLTDQAGLYVMVSKIAATAAVFIWNFTARRYFVFYRPMKEE